MQLTFVRHALSATWLCRPTPAARNIVLDVFQKLPPKNLGLTSHEVYERVLEYEVASQLSPLPKWTTAPHEGHAVRSMRYLKKFVLEELEKEGCITKMTTRRVREVMELGRDDLKVEGVPERKDMDFVWIVTDKGKRARPGDFEPEPREEKQDEEENNEDYDMVKHPISRNARRRKLRELRSLSHKRPIGEQMEKLKDALYGDWMSHEYDFKSAPSSSDANGRVRQISGVEKRGRSSSRPILKGRLHDHAPRPNVDVSQRERSHRKESISFSRRSAVTRSDQNTWIARRALLTPRLPPNLFK